MQKSMERKYHLFDARGKVLGRISTEAALVLSGKRKVDYAPNVDQGDYVVVINSDRVRVTGNKTEGKIYYRYSGYPGGLKKASFRKQKEEDSKKIISMSIRGMLPKNKLGRQMSKRLFVYEGEDHPHKINVTH